MTQNRAKILENEFDEFLKSCNWNEERKFLNDDLQKYFNTYGRTFDDCIYVSLVYFKGFEAINQGLIRPNDYLLNWVKKVDRNRSAKIIANLIATQLVSSLEDLISELVVYGKNNINFFLDDYNALENNVSNDLILYLKPTGKKKYKWPLYLNKLFNIEIPSFIEETLKDLLKTRHDASHTDIDSQENKSGEVIRLWTLGARSLLQKLTFSLQIKMSKNQN